MNITVKIEAPELAGAINNLAAALSGNRQAVTVIEPPKTVVKDVAPIIESSKKEEPKQEEAKEPDTKVQPESETDSSNEEETPTISLEVVRSKLAVLSQAGKQKEVKALITSFGVKKLTEIPEEKYPEVLEAAEKLA